MHCEKAQFICCVSVYINDVLVQWLQHRQMSYQARFINFFLSVLTIANVNHASLQKYYTVFQSFQKT